MYLTISIVSFNNFNVLSNCLHSIYKCTRDIDYEIVVVAYFFSDENLIELKRKYPKVKIIVSNEIRGFSENNNLVLKQSKSDYCLILNDDTYFKDNSIKFMLDTFQCFPDAGFVSPLILNADGSVQLDGRPRYTLSYFILMQLTRIKVYPRMHTIYNAEKIYKTFNVSGCCFMVKTPVLRLLNYFDEDYFFTPEDLALSTKGSKLSFYTYVNRNANVFHLGSTTGTPLSESILPVANLGQFIFFRKEYNVFVGFLVRNISIVISIFLIIGWTLQPLSSLREIKIKGNINCIKFAFSKLSPKELFVKLRKESK